MIGRCHNANNGSFRDYGALGIAVCERWRSGEDGKSGFQCFLSDMGPRPSRRTLDRKDPRLGYSKENCRWATAVQQANNKREHYLTSDQKIELAEARRRANSVLSIEQEHEAIAMMNAGQRQRDVAAHFGVSQHTIATLCRAARRRGEILNVSRRRMTPDQQVEAISLFNGGVTQTELAQRYGVGKDALREMFRQARRSGISIRLVAVSHGKLSTERRAELLRQFHGGENRQAIADRFSISRGRVYQIARDYAAKEPPAIS